MKKEVVTTIKEHTTTVARVYCDDCGKELRRKMACSVARCELCGADLCDSCVATEVSTMGDYREVYCNSCVVISEDYKPLIMELEDRIDNLNDTMTTRCKEARLKIAKSI